MNPPRHDHPRRNVSSGGTEPKVPDKVAHERIVKSRNAAVCPIPADVKTLLWEIKRLQAAFAEAFELWLTMPKAGIDLGPMKRLSAILTGESAIADVAVRTSSLRRIASLRQRNTKWTQ